MGALEEVAQAAPEGLRWFQLYVYKDREVTLDLIKRAERAGYKALAITVDTPQLGRREADIKNRFALPSHLTMGNFAGGAHKSGTKSSGEKGSGLASYVASLIDKTLNWNDIAWVRKNTTMKIVVKGVMTAEDALASVRHRVDGILVSNHGARQLDTVPATIEALPEVVKAVAGRCEVYLDGGVTRGTDALKAVCLGARAVFVGRPVLWGLAHSGEEGVYNAIKLLRDEFYLAMQLMGTVSSRIEAKHGPTCLVFPNQALSLIWVQLFHRFFVVKATNFMYISKRGGEIIEHVYASMCVNMDPDQPER